MSLQGIAGVTAEAWPVSLQGIAGVTPGAWLVSSVD